MINKSHSAFTPQTPSLFVIASPLQLLCALEAIYEFKIEEYKIVFPYIEGKIRYQQVEKMLVSYNLVYDKKIVTVSNSFVSKQFIRSLLSLKNNKYKRIFIGDNTNLLFSSIALKFLKAGGHVVYLDDGTKTLSYLKGESSPSVMRRIRNFINQFAYSTRFAEVNKYFFTLYNDIDTKKIVYPNVFANLGKTLSVKKNKSKVYFIGAVPDVYSDENLCGNEDIFREQFYNILSSISKEYQEPIVYIPHGRDTSDYITRFCCEMGLEYTRLEEAVETYLVKSDFYPSEVYGFMSSALFNIRKMFNDAKIINYCMVSKKSVRYKTAVATSDYYSKHGIENRFIILD